MDDSISSKGKRIFACFTESRPAKEPIRPPIQWISALILSGAKRPGREVDHSSPFDAYVKNGGAKPPLPHMSSWRGTSLSTGTFYYYQWLHSPLLGLNCFFSFLILYTVGRDPWTRDQPDARPLGINAHRHSCLGWDSNPGCQCLCGRRQPMPQTTRPL
jgi:hypothetical protein